MGCELPMNLFKSHRALSIEPIYDVAVTILCLNQCNVLRVLSLHLRYFSVLGIASKVALEGSSDFVKLRDQESKTGMSLAALAAEKIGSYSTSVEKTSESKA